MAKYIISTYMPDRNTDRALFVFVTLEATILAGRAKKLINK